MLRIFIWEKTRRIEDALMMTGRMTDGIQERMMLIDSDFKIPWANKKQKQLFGEAVGDYCYQATHHRDSSCQPPNDICSIFEIPKTGELSPVAHNHLDKQRNSLFMEVTAYPIKYEIGMDGIDALRKIKEIRPDTDVIMITVFPEEATAKEAMKLGAYDYIIKPFDLAYPELCLFTKISVKEKFS